MNAYDDGVRTLYKFMQYPVDGRSPELHRDLRGRVEALISPGELYFPTGAELNDPFEGSPHFRAHEGTPEEVFERFSQSLRRINASQLHWDEAQMQEVEQATREKIQSGEYRALADTIEAKYRPLFRTDYPMLCLGATRDSIQMWSYYAGGHTGVCVHFDARQVPIGNAMRVNYDDEYPTLPLPLDGLPPRVVVTLALCTKARAWEHEHEYRLINFPTEGRPPGRVLDDVLGWKRRQLAVLPPQHVVAISLGALMPDHQIETLLRVCHDRRPRIPVYRAVLQRRQFGLRFEALE